MRPEIALLLNCDHRPVVACHEQVLAVVPMRAVGRARAFGLLAAREVVVRVPAADVEALAEAVPHAVGALQVLQVATLAHLQRELRHHLQMPEHLEGHTSHR